MEYPGTPDRFEGRCSACRAPRTSGPICVEDKAAGASRMADVLQATI